MAWPSFLTLTACGGGGGGGGGISLTISSVSVSIDNPVSITGSNAHRFPLSGTCSLQDQPVTLNVGGIVPSNQPVCERGKWEIVLNVTKLLGGEDKSITVSADHETPDGEYTDTNNKPVTVIPIGVTIDDKEKLDKIHAGNDSKFPLAGTCSEEGYAVDVRIGAASVTPKPKCQSGKWSAEMNLSFLYDGAEAEKFTFGVAATHSSLSGASKDTTASVSKVGVYMQEPAKVIDQFQ